MTSGKSRNHSMEIDMVIVVLMAVCIIGMITISNYKLEEIFDSHQESLLVRDISGDDISDEFAEQIVRFRPDMCKMIEVYSADMELTLRMQFTESHTHDDHLDAYPELVDLFRSHKEGHTVITTDDEEEDIYFRWEPMRTNGEECLTIVYMTRPIVKNLWVVPLLGYTVLILAFVLLIHMKIVQHDEKIKMYQYVTKEMQDQLLH